MKPFISGKFNQAVSQCPPARHRVIRQRSMHLRAFNMRIPSRKDQDMNIEY